MPVQTVTNLRNIPLAALIPGVMGLIPFWFFAVASNHDIGIDPVTALLGLLGYGSVILSFVGAIWWGIAAHTEAGIRRNAMFLWSVFPALIGWFAMVVTPDVGLIMLMSGLCLQWLLDSILHRRLPLLITMWMLQLRTLLTIGACTALIYGWYGLRHAMGAAQ